MHICQQKYRRILDINIRHYVVTGVQTVIN